MSSAAPHPLQSRTPGVVLGALIGAAIVGALVAVLLLAGVLRSGAVSQAGRTEGPGHSTPEDAVAAYMEGLAQADLEVMLRLRLARGADRPRGDDPQSEGLSAGGLAPRR